MHVCARLCVCPSRCVWLVILFACWNKTSCLLVYTCLFGHTSVVSFGHISVVLFTQDSASLCTLVYMSLYVCSCIFVHTNQYLYRTKSGLFSLARVLKTQYLSAHVSVCPFARLLVCTSACLHMYLLDCTCIWLCTHMSACFTCDDYILHQLSGCFFQVAVCLPKCLIVSSDCLFIQMFASLQVCSWFVLLNDAWSKHGHPVAYTTSTLTSKVLDGLTTFLFSV